MYFDLYTLIYGSSNSFSPNIDNKCQHYTGEVGVDKNGREYRKYELRWGSEKAW
ncbi:unnamed protein product, partial [marine sediment metagenome]